MPRLLVVYGTTDGQTGKVTDFLAAEWSRLGARVDRFEAEAAPADLSGYDGVIVAASVHAGGYQQPVIGWVQSHAAILGAMPSAFISVSLGILQKDPAVRRDLDGILGRFVRESRWHPGMVKEVAGALKYREYGWLKRRVMRYMAAKAGGSTDTSRNHEYTDWADLRRWAGAFLVDFPEWSRPVLNARSSGEADYAA
ncbi:MAG TPA: flavodoxin domain-containing protein [Gemmatimonadales bacterium]|nr:flavodoxin domain-containing protein [Gemmatimonadales bacterium]